MREQGDSASRSGQAPNVRLGSEEDAAALMIQKHWRGYQSRQNTKQIKLDHEARWDDLVKQTHQQSYADQQLSNQNDVHSRWSRAVHAASRLQAGDGVYEAEGRSSAEAKKVEMDEKTRKNRKATFMGSLSLGIGKEGERDEGEELPFQSKALEQQHWLEMIDGKHRYGSNMKYYFRAWREAETQDNFFRWLDRGDGKDLDLEVLPRERLEKERIQYLSAEQRLNYLVKVDGDGKLRWAKNGEYVDTAAHKWRDAGPDVGIVPTDKLTHGNGDEDGVAEADDNDDDSLSGYSATSDLQDNEDTHYVGLDKQEGWLESKWKGITPGGMKKELLRKTVRRNTWIYVSDMKLNLFVGMKLSGKFQHSSFLAGGKVTSAGLIIIKQGLIKSLNPLSGHYRSSIQHYRSFIHQLEGLGADLSHVKLAKSVLNLWGLSKYSRLTKGSKDLTSKFKKAMHLPHEPTEMEKSEEVERNAQKEEEEHMERMRKVKEAEEREESGEAKERAAKEVLFGDDKKQMQEKTEDTAGDVREA